MVEKRKTRSAGVLAHITMLPGQYGCGTLGQSAYDFCNWLASMGFSAWQVLPLQPPAAGNSPYTAFSAFARNPLLLDPELLAEEGWISTDDCRSLQVVDEYVSDFDAASARIVTIRSLVSLPELPENWLETLPTGNDAFDAWVTQEWDWLAGYCKYMALRECFDYAHWWHWPAPYRDGKGAMPAPWKPIHHPFHRHGDGKKLKKRSGVFAVMPRWSAPSSKTIEENARWHAWLQWQLSIQWNNLHEYAQGKGIRIIGDMPIYVAPDSADVWANRRLFRMVQPSGWKTHVERAWFSEVAGVPPDYFAEDGQLWGNPLYNWGQMAQDGYRWWIRRVQVALADFDAVRIDHFRGFANYWAVPATAKTAKSGAWQPGPGVALFQAIEKVLPNPAIIAEDLGDIDEPVRKLLHDTGYPGMRVMQFAFLSQEDNLHLPHNYPENTVAYTGTHDNNTLLGWLWEITPQQRQFVVQYCGIQPEEWKQGGALAPGVRAVARALWQSPAALAVVPIQDILGYGADTRMNVPGVAHGNWRIRFTQEALDSADVEGWRCLNEVFMRIPCEQELAVDE